MIRHVGLTEILQNGEGQTVEFKKSLSLQRESLESLCAMVNAETARGMVVFGIAPDKTICGIEPGNLDTAQRTLSQAVRNKYEPPLVVLIETTEINGKLVLLLSAERDKAVAYHEFDGRAWIREGSTNRLLTLVEKESLTSIRNRDKHPGPWRCNLCGSLVGVLYSFELSDHGMKKTYGCDCGGEFWPAN